MFNWLFGDGGKEKKQAEDQLTQLADYKDRVNALSQSFNTRINNGQYTDDNIAQLMTANDYYGKANKQADEVKKQLDDVVKSHRYDYFGNGMLGGLLNPIGQTVSAGVDLASGNYGENDRDVLSDLGALGTTALSFIPVGSAASGAGKLFGSLGANVGLGAGIGAAESLRESGADTNFGDVLKNAGIGAAFGGGIGAIGNKMGGYITRKGADNIVNKTMAKSAGLTDQFAQNPAMRDKMVNAYATNPTIAETAGFGGLYKNSLESILPKNRYARYGMYGGGGLLGMKLLGGGGEQGEQQQMYDPYGQMGGY